MNDEEGAFFSYIHPQEGKWCVAVQTGFALEVSLKLLVHEVSCPEARNACMRRTHRPTRPTTHNHTANHIASQSVNRASRARSVLRR